MKGNVSKTREYTTLDEEFENFKSEFNKAEEEWGQIRNSLNINYIWYANVDAVAEISNPVLKVGVISDFIDTGNVFSVVAASGVIVNGIIPNVSAKTVVPKTKIGDYELFNNGDMLICAGVYDGSAVWKRLPMYEAKTNLEGFMSAWDKQQVDSIPDMKQSLSSLSTTVSKLPKEVVSHTESGLINWFTTEGIHYATLGKGSGRDPMPDEEDKRYIVYVGKEFNGTDYTGNKFQLAQHIKTKRVFYRCGSVPNGKSFNDYLWTELESKTTVGEINSENNSDGSIITIKDGKVLWSKLFPENFEYPGEDKKVLGVRSGKVAWIDAPSEKVDVKEIDGEDIENGSLVGREGGETRWTKLYPYNFNYPGADGKFLKTENGVVLWGDLPEAKSDIITVENGTPYIIRLTDSTREVVFKGNVKTNILLPENLWKNWRCILDFTNSGEVEVFDVGYGDDAMFGTDAPWDYPVSGKVYMLLRITDGVSPSAFSLIEVDSRYRIGNMYKELCDDEIDNVPDIKSLPSMAFYTTSEEDLYAPFANAVLYTTEPSSVTLMEHIQILQTAYGCESGKTYTRWYTAPFDNFQAGVWSEWIECEDERYERLEDKIDKIPFVNSDYASVIGLTYTTHYDSVINTKGEIIPHSGACCVELRQIKRHSGEAVYITGACMQTAPLYVFKGDTGNITELGWGNGETELTAVKDYPVTVPENSIVCYVNQLTTNPSTPILQYTKKFEANTEDIADEAITSDKLANDVKDEIAYKADGIVNTAHGTIVNIRDGADKSIQGLTIYGKSIQDGTPTPTAPVDITNVGDSGSLDIYSAKKNLLPQWTGTTETKTGITFTKNDDGSVSVEGTATAGTSVAVIDTVLPAGDYIISGASGGTSATYSLQLRYLDDSGSLKYVVVYDGDVAFTFNESKNITVYVWVLSGATVSTTIYPMIRLADNTDSTYEPYKGISAEVAVSEPLRALPVASGGNVTIDGREYIADVLCVNADGSGYIERKLAKTQLNPTSVYLVGGSLADTNTMQLTGITVKTNVVNVMCTHLNNMGEKNAPSEGCISCSGTGTAYFRINLPGYSEEEALSLFTENEVYLCYAPVTPITENLTAEQVTALLALETYKPITNAYNSDGSPMDITYMADTKNYIDNSGGGSGDNSWMNEPVLEIELTEDIAKISVNTDKNGNPFNYEKCIFRFEFPTGSHTANMEQRPCVQLYNISASYNGMATQAHTGTYNEENNYYTRAELYKTGEEWCLKSLATAGTSWLGRLAQEYNFYTMPNNAQYEKQNTIDKITELCIIPYTGSFRAGAKIVIYGKPIKGVAV